MNGAEPSNPNFRAFLLRLRALGWIEGKNLLLDRRSTEGRYQLAPGIFSELVKNDTEVMVIVGAYFTKLALEVMRTVPLAMAGATSPVEVVEKFVEHLRAAAKSMEKLAHQT
jgi:hypothetical protein